MEKEGTEGKMEYMVDVVKNYVMDVVTDDVMDDMADHMKDSMTEVHVMVELYFSASTDKLGEKY